MTLAASFPLSLGGCWSMRQSLRNQPAIRTSNFRAMNFYGKWKIWINSSWQMFLVWESTSKSTIKKQDDRMIDVCLLFLLSMCRSPHVERIGWFPTRNSENLSYLWQDPTLSFACKFIDNWVWHELQFADSWWFVLDFGWICIGFLHWGGMWCVWYRSYQCFYPGW